MKKIIVVGVLISIFSMLLLGCGVTSSKYDIITSSDRYVVLDKDLIDTGDIVIASEYIIDTENIFKMKYKGDTVYLAVVGIAMAVTDASPFVEQRLELISPSGNHVMIDNLVDIGFYRKESIDKVDLSAVKVDDNWVENTILEEYAWNYIKGKGKKYVREGFEIK